MCRSARRAQGATNEPCRKRASIRAGLRRDVGHPRRPIRSSRCGVGRRYSRVHEDLLLDAHHLPGWQDGGLEKGSADVLPVRQRNCSKIDNCYCPRRQPLLLRRANFRRATCPKSTRFASRVKSRANVATAPAGGPNRVRSALERQRRKPLAGAACIFWGCIASSLAPIALIRSPHKEGSFTSPYSCCTLPVCGRGLNPGAMRIPGALASRALAQCLLAGFAGAHALEPLACLC